MRTSFITIAFAGFFATSMAIPATLTSRQTTICSSGTQQCCDVDVLGIADLNCETPPSVPTDIPDFNSICAAIGKEDMCCILPILDQGIICSSPDGS